MTGTQKTHRRPHSARHLARVFTLLGLYQWIADPTLRYTEIESHLAGLINEESGELEGSDISPADFERADKTLFHDLLSGVLLDAQAVEEVFKAFVDRDLKRVSLVERAILFLGTYELMKCPQTPYRVVLNESIELAKQFGRGYRFTNAVLEHVAQTVRKTEFDADHAAKA